MGPYRPLTNIFNIGKVIECATNSQLYEYIDIVLALPINQSAYCKHYSTETVICSVMNDLLYAMNSHDVHFIIIYHQSAFKSCSDRSRTCYKPL